MIDTRRGFDAPVGISTGVLFPERETRHEHTHAGRSTVRSTVRSTARNDVGHDVRGAVRSTVSNTVRNEVSQSTGPAEVGLFDRPNWPQTVAYDPGPQQVIGFPEPHRPGQRQPRPRPEFIYEQPVTPWYRAKRVWLAAALLLVAVAVRFTLSPEPAQLQSAQLQPVEIQPVDGDR